MTAAKPRARRTEPDPALVADFAADYADAVCLPVTKSHRAQKWAYYSLRGADVAGGIFTRLIWGGVLGFRLAPKGAPETLVGWRSTVDEPDRYVLDTDGRLMAGRMIFQTFATEVRWTTMLRYHRSAAARIWTVAGKVHRALTPRLLRIAHHTLDREHAQR